MGSLLFLSSWAFLMGPYQYATHLISGPRLPFTATYLGAIALTIYFAVGVSLESNLHSVEANTPQLHSTLLTLLSSMVVCVRTTRFERSLLQTSKRRVGRGASMRNRRNLPSLPLIVGISLKMQETKQVALPFPSIHSTFHGTPFGLLCFRLTRMIS